MLSPSQTVFPSAFSISEISVVVEAFTGAQAVEIAKNNDIHLILLDVMQYNP